MDLILLLSLVLLVEKSSSEECNSTELIEMRLDRPGHIGMLEICWWKNQHYSGTTHNKYEWRNIGTADVQTAIDITALACHNLGYSQGEEICFLRGQSQSSSITINCETRLNSTIDLQHCDILHDLDFYDLIGVICNHPIQQSIVPIIQQESTVSVIQPGSTVSDIQSTNTLPAQVSTSGAREHTVTMVTMEIKLASSTNDTSLNSSQNTVASHGRVLGSLGGGLGAALGILIMVSLGLLSGLMYYRNKANFYREMVEKNWSQLDNPIYDTSTSSTSASQSVNHYRI